jgi:hypothetical protein
VTAAYNLRCSAAALTSCITRQVADFGGGEVAIFSGGEFGAVCRLMLAVPLAPGAGPQDIQVRLWPAGAQADGARLIKPTARPAATAVSWTTPHEARRPRYCMYCISNMTKTNFTRT